MNLAQRLSQNGACTVGTAEGVSSTGDLSLFYVYYTSNNVPQTHEIKKSQNIL
jgi:hypothetical protein